MARYWFACVAKEIYLLVWQKTVLPVRLKRFNCLCGQRDLIACVAKLGLPVRPKTGVPVWLIKTMSLKGKE